ncbi:MAG: nucleotidyltransferase domain-containing protein, partial [Thermoguttaceae bacterium]
MDARLKTILTELGDDLRSLYGDRLVRLVLFGSHARGDAVPGSDIDVLVVLRGPVEPGLEIERTGRSKATLCLKYDEVISTTFVSA